MDGKVCIVTGASSGLGKGTAQGLSKLGATVILACRNKGRGEAALAEIKATTGSDRLDLLVVDLSLQQSVREMVADFKERYNRLDVLINNAAGFTRQRTVTSEGVESMFATNHLGPFLLTNLLLDVLKGSAPARILSISAPSTTPVEFDDLQGERRFSAFRAFGASKTCNLLFTYELARRLAGTGVTANVIHPGLVKSNLLNEQPRLIRWLSHMFSTTPERAAETIVYYASSPEVEGLTGRFFKARNEIESSPYSKKQDVQRHLWDVSLTLTKLG